MNIWQDFESSLFWGHIEGWAKKNWYGHIKWDWKKGLMNEFGDFNVSNGWLAWFYGRFDFECRTLYITIDFKLSINRLKST